MKILILSNKDLASNFALNLLLPKLFRDHEIHLWLSAKVGKNNARAKQLDSLKFFEQDLFNNILSPLINPKLETKLSADNLESDKFSTFDGLSTFLNAKIREVSQINGLAEIQDVKDIAPDLIVSIRFGGILKSPIINIPKLGVINLHSGILPKYKGVMATFWALSNDEKEIGTTLHTIDDASIDTGKILKTSKRSVDREQSYLSQVLILYKQGTLDIVEAINTLAMGKKLLAVQQQPSDTYFTFPTQKQCENFETKGLKLIDEHEYQAFIHRYYM